LPDDGFFPQRLTYHLEHAGRTDELHALVAGEGVMNPWFTALDALGLVASFRADVERALALSALEFAQTRTSKPVARIIHCALLKSSVHGLADAMPLRLPALLWSLGTWPRTKVDQVLANLLSAEDRVEGRCAMAASLPVGIERDDLVLMALDEASGAWR
jgi:hypothetical protein